MSPFHRTLCISVLFLCVCRTGGFTQSDTAAINRLLQTPLHYTVPRTSSPPAIDGDLSDPAWQTAPWTEYFTDIEGDLRPKPLYHTRVKMLWDDQYLYIGAEMEEPNIWAYVKNHDEVVFHDNDFEVFINPDNNARHYFEIEVNAIQTIFDLFLPEPYRNGGGALVSWDAAGLKKAVRINGTLNDPGDTDRGWTVEYAIPIASISMGNGPETPRPGSLWRINFSRVEWDTDVRDGKYVKRTDPSTHRPLPEHNWVWSPQGVINMHCPERWGYLLFAVQADASASTASGATGSGTPGAPFTLPLAERLKNKLWEVYYRQQVYYQAHGVYASTTELLGMGPVTAIAGQRAVLILEATAHTYKALIASPDTGESWNIDPQGFIENAGRRH
jgi:hypothetical protein